MEASTNTILMGAFIKKHQTGIASLLALLVVCAFWYLTTHFADAETPTAGTKPAPKTETDWTVRIGQYIGFAILGIASMITYIGGFLLDQSMSIFVINIRDLIHGSGFNATLTNMWGLIRDICNLAFIFGFIYVGIKLIIDADDSFSKRQLATIIIGALLINFSLFFVKIVIDVSNYIAVEVYNTLTVTAAGADGKKEQVNIAAKFASLLGISSYFLPPKAEDFAKITGAGGLSFYFMGAIMLIVAGFVLAAGALLLVIRFVALVLIMIFSPLLFAATVFPATAHYAGELWHKLFNYSFFAPAYLFLLFLSIKVLEAFSAQINPGKATLSAGLVESTPDSFAVVLNFIVVIMFLIMALQAAMKFGVAGGDKAISIGNSLRGKVQSVVGRNTVGRASASLLKDYERLNADAKKTRAGRFVGRALKYGSLGMLDDRNIRGTLESGTKAKFGGSYSHADDEAYASEQKKRQAVTSKQQKFEATIDNRSILQQKLGVPSPLSLLNREPTNDAERKQKQELEKAILSASTKQLEELEQEQRIAMVALMTQSQIDGLNKSDSLTDEEKDEMNDARSSVIKEKYGTVASGKEPLTDARKRRDDLGKASSDDLASLGAEFLAEPKHAMRLTSSQMDDLKKKLAPTEYATVDAARTETLEQMAKGTLPAEHADGKTALTHILRMKSSEMAKLPKQVLKHLATQLPIATLTEIRKQNTLSVEDQKAIRTAIENEVEAVNSHSGEPPEGMDMETFLNEMAERGTRANTLKKWLDESPYGKEFGK